MGVKYWRFFACDLAGALISCPISIWLAYHYGHDAEEKIRENKPYFFAALGLIVLFGLFRWWRHNCKKNSKAALIAAEPRLSIAPAEVGAEVRK